MEPSDAWRNAGFPDSFFARDLSVYKAIAGALRERAAVFGVPLDFLTLDSPFALLSRAAQYNNGGGLLQNFKTLETAIQRIYESGSCFLYDPSETFEDFLERYHYTPFRHFDLIFSRKHLIPLFRILNNLSKLKLSRNDLVSCRILAKNIVLENVTSATPFTRETVIQILLSALNAAEYTVRTPDSVSLRTTQTVSAEFEHEGNGYSMSAEMDVEAVEFQLSDTRSFCFRLCRENGDFFEEVQTTQVSAGTVGTFRSTSLDPASGLPLALPDPMPDYFLLTGHHTPVLVKDYNVPDGFSYHGENEPADPIS